MKDLMELGWELKAVDCDENGDHYDFYHAQFDDKRRFQYRRFLSITVNTKEGTGSVMSYVCERSMNVPPLVDNTTIYLTFEEIDAIRYFMLGRGVRIEDK